MDLIKYKVTGTVQGVNFRATTQRQAQKLGLKGWVRNSPDESVEGLAVGPTEKIEQFRSYLKQGPSAARVSGVELLQEKKGISEAEAKEALGGVSGFVVK